jgi:hypothetical protein
MKKMITLAVALLIATTSFGQENEYVKLYSVQETFPPTAIAEVFFHNGTQADWYTTYRTDRGYVLTADSRDYAVFRPTRYEIDQILSDISMKYAMYTSGDVDVRCVLGQVRVIYVPFNLDIGTFADGIGFVPSNLELSPVSEDNRLSRG